MDLHDIYFVPLAGGQDDSGRKRVLGFSVWHRDAGKFLDCKTGDWGDRPVINPLKEQGRNELGAKHETYGPLRGVYAPQGPVLLGPEPLQGRYTVLIHDRGNDGLVIHREEVYYPPPPGPEPPLSERLVAAARRDPMRLVTVGLLGLLVILVLARR